MSKWTAHFIAGLGLLPFLAGCAASDSSDPQAPTPIANPGAHVWLSYRITPEHEEFDSVNAVAHWVLENHACAPLRHPSGSRIEKQVTVAADVRREGKGFIVRALADQFQPGTCIWVYAGISANLTKGTQLVGAVGATPSMLKESGGIIDLICNPNPRWPTCFDRVHFEHADALRASHPDSFYLRLEQLQ